MIHARTVRPQKFFADGNTTCDVEISLIVLMDLVTLNANSDAWDNPQGAVEASGNRTRQFTTKRQTSLIIFLIANH